MGGERTTSARRPLHQERPRPRPARPRLPQPAPRSAMSFSVSVQSFSRTAGSPAIGLTGFSVVPSKYFPVTFSEARIHRHVERRPSPLLRRREEHLGHQVEPPHVARELRRHDAGVERVHRHAGAGELVGPRDRVEHVRQLARAVRLHPRERALLEHRIVEIELRSHLHAARQEHDPRRRARLQRRREQARQEVRPDVVHPEGHLEPVGSLLLLVRRHRRVVHQHVQLRVLPGERRGERAHRRDRREIERHHLHAVTRARARRDLAPWHPRPSPRRDKR